ncbi:uncharacterized protein LOC111997856 [Quercus suber]|uniref:uncharacterized protein LOC111997856 n=1 Tax=Quercus suber TaxID=58331 RepID=UPI0032DE8B4F
MTPIVSFLQDGHLPQNADEVRKVKKRVARFTILNDTLYKRGFSMPYLKCVDEEEAKYILVEIHEGICRDHASPGSLVDAADLVKKCDKCQRFRNVQRLPADKLTVRDSQDNHIKQWMTVQQPSFRDFCSNMGIKNQFSSPGHPQANGQIEVTNQTLLKIIKTKLDDAKGAWPKEFPNILWAYRTTARTLMGETLFRLTYGTEAVIPVEVGLASIR